ncbi:MAG: ornithine cyclodeaminase family protein [Rhodospirillaceae bacterium]|nr:ornithine cyclodeaminase family protein [Rhodospirillaceae bacterium]
MIILTKSDVVKLLPAAACIDVVASAMRQTSERRVSLPLRQFMPVPNSSNGRLGLMPGYIAEPARFGLKIVSKYDRPPGSPHGTHVGAVMLFDAGEGLPLALMDGGSLTAIRTAAASALATRTLARADARTLGMIGCGEEAHVHIPAMLAVRKFAEVLVWGRNAERAKAFVDHLHLPAGVTARAVASAEQVVAASDVICTVTSAATPILMGQWIKPGTHLNLVGSAVATTAEVDSECVKRARFYVDYREAAMAQAGELLNAIKAGVVTTDHIVGEIGEVLIGKVPGRRSADEITLYKSLGIAAQDLTAAEYVYTAARNANVGVSVDLGS